jgi:hypothetical protein
MRVPEETVIFLLYVLSGICIWVSLTIGTILCVPLYAITWDQVVRQVIGQGSAVLCCVLAFYWLGRHLRKNDD